MRRPALATTSFACAIALGMILVSSDQTALSAATEQQLYRPLSSIAPGERFGQPALDQQAEFVARMPGVSVRYGDNGAVSEMKGHTRIFIQSGLAGFRVGQPHSELLEKFAPALLAAGTEELRVRRISNQAAIADSAARANSPERTVRLVQYIRGREVERSTVNISLNIQTNEVTHFVADFLPDRGLQHEPRFTADEARAKVESAMLNSALDPERRIIFEDAPARLAYAFEEIGDRGGIGGVLVWVFQATRSGESLEASVNALTGEVVRLQERAFGLNRVSYTAHNAAPAAGSFPGGLTMTFAKGELRPMR